MPSRWQHVKEVFFRAADLDADARDAFLAQACRDDPELRVEVEALLESDRRTEPWFWRPAVDAVPELLTGGSGDSLVGRQIGAHRVVAEVGRGGMGTVYLAERADGQYEERVALKVVRASLANAELAARFRRERQILARLRHPFIARLQDGGLLDDGRPYLVMEWIQGEPIDRHVTRARLSHGTLFKLFYKVCEAVAVAHRSLVVHCDLKPANVLVTPEGIPKILDFGVARLLDDRKLLISPGDGEGEPPVPFGPPSLARWLTPDYASPEQIRGDALTTASDVYSLGTILAELLGLEPDAAADSGPSSAKLGGDLRAILGKARHPDPLERYGSAAELADDLQRHLGSRPVLARRSTLVYRASRFVRRHKLAAAVAGLLAVSLIAGLAATLWQARKAEARARQAEQLSDFLIGLFEVSDVESPEGRISTLRARDLLDFAQFEIHQLDGSPSLKAEIQSTIGKAYRSQGLFDKAEEWLTRALDLASGDFAAELRSEIGLLRYRQGRYEDAAGLLRAALREQRALSVPPPAIADTLNHLGLTERRLGNLVRAEQAHVQALDLRRRHLGEEHLDVTYSLVNLGVLGLVHCRRGETVACRLAFERLEQALELRRASLPAGHPLIAGALDHLARAWLVAGRGRESLVRAEALRGRALELRERALPAGHPDIGLSQANLAYVLALQERYKAAEAAYRRALDVLVETHHEAHSSVLSARLGLATVLFRQRRCSEAEEGYRQVLAVARQASDAGTEEQAQSGLERIRGGCGGVSGVGVDD